MVEYLLRIDTKYATAGVVMRDGVCVEAAPIFRWMLGKTEEEIRRWKQIIVCRRISAT